ncbi:transposase, partial [Roseinatronobacter thiooxidans]|uniref:transposase n=2 Tax=Roseinatronobacter thiooxidans TaxID=121821 RepID=UPI001C4352E7
SAHVLITFKNPMSITPYAPSWFKPEQGCTWVNSQWPSTIRVKSALRWLKRRDRLKILVWGGTGMVL